MRIAIADILQETCTFNPIPTGLEEFALRGLYFADEILEKARGVGKLGGFLAAAEEEGCVEPLPIIQAMAMPGGRVTAEALELFREKLVSGLKRALPLDGVFLSLHGAAAAEQVDDVEGTLLAAVREVIGDRVPLVVPLDHHANITRQMAQAADVMIGYRAQPHDTYETGMRAAKLLFRLVEGEISPALGWQKIPMVAPQDRFLTSEGPMKVWFDLAREMEKQPGVIAASNFPMQPWLDVDEAGWAAVVYTDNDPGLAQALAAELANKAWELREEFWVSDRVSPEEAIRRAVEARDGLVILSDTGDTGGGGPGDSTCLLKEMLRQRITCTALLPMVDADVVEEAISAGAGREITVRVGGKLDDLFSEPVQITGRVAAISDGLQIRLEHHGFCDLRRTVLLEIGSIKMVVSERRVIASLYPIMYTHLGVDLAGSKMVVLKTGGNFQHFAPWDQELIRVDTPGMTQSNLHAFNWTRAPRPIYPLDELTAWQAQG